MSFQEKRRGDHPTCNDTGAKDGDTVFLSSDGRELTIKKRIELRKKVIITLIKNAILIWKESIFSYNMLDY